MTEHRVAAEKAERRARSRPDNGPIGGNDLAQLADERALVAAAIALGARDVTGWSARETALARRVPRIPPAAVRRLREQIRAGHDPLGDAFCRLRPAEKRRAQGATYTPRAIVEAMVDWGREARPSRIVDPGAGSARYLLRAARRFPRAQLVGIELDPLAAMLARANLAAAGCADRAQIVVADYRAATLPPIEGRTFYVGNPPYVRHHGIAPRWKRWLTDEAANRGHAASQLAGLHVHFFLATVAHARPGDVGALITAAEWLDVNYGSLVRDLFLAELGGQRIVVIEPTAMPFPDAATTAAITCFSIGAKPKQIKLKRVDRLKALKETNGNRYVRRERMETERRWSHLTRPVRKGPAGYVELGELFRVHRGQVTGSNKIWIAGPHSEGLPERVLFPSVTMAHELFRAGKVLSDASVLRKVIDLPVDLDEIDKADRSAIDRFLKRAKASGAAAGYIAQNRRVWWAVGLREPAPILATYMARRPPAFVRNMAAARHINIAHGLYPREPLSETVLINLVVYLSRAVSQHQGRTYAGGLTKFEPREVQSLRVPDLETLSAIGPSPLSPSTPAA